MVRHRDQMFAHCPHTVDIVGQDTTEIFKKNILAQIKKLYISLRYFKEPCSLKSIVDFFPKKEIKLWKWMKVLNLDF